MNENNTQNVIPNVDSKSQEERNVPDLRFSFEDSWIKKKLSDISIRITRKNKKLESTLPLTISAEYGLVDQETFFNRKVASNNIEGYYLLYNGEFAYNKSYSNNYPWGAIKRLDSYDKGVISTLYICFKPKDEINSDYLTHYFETTKWHNQISEIAVEGARNHGLLNIPVNDFFNTFHMFPTSEEQLKIATFLNLIQLRIETQKKIINNLKSLIISIKNREFYNSKGYNEKLENILIEINDKTIINNQYEVLSSTIKGIVKQSEYFDRTVASENNIGYKIVNRGNIVVSPQNLWMGNISYNDKFEVGIVSPSYKIFNVNNNFNEQYIFEMLTTKKSLYLFKTISEQGASIVRRNLNYEAFMQLTFNIPSLNKQNEFIEKLNLLQDKLCLENKILSLFEKQKQYLLNKLFI